MKSFITWCFIVALLGAPILAEEEEEVDKEQQKRQILSTADPLLHATEDTSADLVAAPTATPAPVLHTQASPFVARAFINHPVAFPAIHYPYAFPFQKSAIPLHVAPYPALSHAYQPAPVYLPHTHYPHYPSSALKVVPAPNLAPSFSPFYRYTDATPFGFGYHPALKYF